MPQFSSSEIAKQHPIFEEHNDMFMQVLKDIFVFNQDSPLLFTQFYFWAFFAIVFAIFSLLKNRILLRNAFLAAASVFFYYKTSGLFVLLLGFTVVFNFYYARLIAASDTDRRKRMHLAVAVGINLFTLFYYKYAYFVTDMLNGLFGTNIRVFDVFAMIGNAITGSERFDAGSILLPIGISFFTFQNISYLVDIFRRRVEPVCQISDYAFYVAFFPQLVAGPIVRANEFIPQIYKPFFLSRRQFGIAVFWIMNGLAKKIILSDYIAVNFVDRVFENPAMYSGFENLAALFGYSLQVYADFSGYTDIAIGVAMLFGFYLPKNFNSPYKAANAANFWKRWHISLSKWLQDYLYIPLGGNREATFGTYICIVSIALIAIILASNIWVSAVILLIAAAVLTIARLKPEKRRKITTSLNNMDTMLLGGLWHGASWNFVVWGGLNGLGILVYKVWKNKPERFRIIALASLTAIFAVLWLVFRKPVWTIAVVWTAVLLAGTLMLKIFPSLSLAWAVLQTFVFITFTRLFFRAGSNLDPAEANREAWQTASDMAAQIGGTWDFSIIGSIIAGYSTVFLLITAGMIIHWLPEKWKRRYRIWFVRMPLIPMAIAVVAIIFILYQFVTADLQKFIYFQF
ncbi:MAG: MBOAT family protein [Dysgonamonadaceae bacterium]|nr:MBOAT family protein [Dysgonamonadaceae bacterium]